MKYAFLILLFVAGLAGQTPIEDFYRPLVTNPDTGDGAYRILSYQPKAEDTLFHIARRFLGDPYQAQLIARMNGIEDPFRLDRSKKLRIPLPAFGLLYDIETNRECELAIPGPDGKYRSGDRFRLRVSTNIDGYVYVFNQGPDGSFRRLDVDPGGLRVRRFGEYVVPSDAWFRFDSEREADALIILVSAEPLSDADSETAAENASEAVSESASQTRDAQPARGVARGGRARSLVLASPIENRLVLAHRIVFEKQ